MAIIDVNQSLADIKSIGLVDNILGNFDSDLKECQFPSDNGAKEWRKAYTLTIPAKPTGVASITVQRTASQMSDISAATWNAGASAQNVEVRYKDTLTASAFAATGYNSPNLSWASKTVDGNVALSCSAGSVMAFTLTKSSLPTGVSAHTVTRTSSPLAGASTGALSNGATIYYGDVLTQTATAASGYNAPSVNWSTITVDGNETATVTAGAKNKAWVSNVAFTYSNGQYVSTQSHSGVEQVRAAFSIGDKQETLIGTPNLSRKYLYDTTTGWVDDVCDCGEYGYHDCPCYGGYVEPGYETTQSYSGYVTITYSNNYIYIKVEGDALFISNSVEVYK